MANQELFITLVVAVLVESFFIHLAARLVVGTSRFGRAVLVAVLGSLLAFLVFLILGKLFVLALVLALLCWLAVCASVYRTTFVPSLLIGLLAYLLWVGTKLLIDAVVGQLSGA